MKYREMYHRDLTPDDDGTGADMRRSAYHRFFAGYSEMRENGDHGKILRKYVGKYYLRCCDDKQMILTKVLYCLLFIGSAAVYLVSIAGKKQVNTVLYVVLPQMISIISLLVTGVHVAKCLMAPKKMKIFQYRSSFEMLLILCPVCAGAQLLTAIGTLTYALIHFRGEGSSALGLCLLQALAALMQASIWAMEHRAKYDLLDNIERPFDSGVIIE